MLWGDVSCSMLSAFILYVCLFMHQLLCSIVREAERPRERERGGGERDRQTDRQRQRQRMLETDSEQKTMGETPKETKGLK